MKPTRWRWQQSLVIFLLLIPTPILAASSIKQVAARVANSNPPPKKLIALTFDDGPKPYVLFGQATASGEHSASLLELLKRENIHATFFVMGWRLAKSADKWCVKEGGRTCRAGAEAEHLDGDEIENHTYGHGDFRLMEKRYGDAWILNDIDRCSNIIQSITGERPHFIRPPDWDIWPALQKKIEARGYHVMSKSLSLPPALRDVDSQDYFCFGPSQPHCPKQGIEAYVLEQIHRRESEGIYDHILAFHELPITVNVLTRLIPELKSQGYQFVLLRTYFKEVNQSAQ